MQLKGALTEATVQFNLIGPPCHCSFLAALVALHFTPVSESVSQWAEFRTSVAPRLASLLLRFMAAAITG